MSQTVWNEDKGGNKENRKKSLSWVSTIWRTGFFQNTALKTVYFNLITQGSKLCSFVVGGGFWWQRTLSWETGFQLDEGSFRGKKSYWLSRKKHGMNYLRNWNTKIINTAINKDNNQGPCL